VTLGGRELGGHLDLRAVFRLDEPIAGATPAAGILVENPPVKQVADIAQSGIA